MVSKLQLAYGQFQLTYEGATEFTKKDIIEFIDLLDTKNFKPINSEKNKNTGSENSDSFDLTTEAIAHKYNSSTGTTLIQSACLHLTLVKNMTTFSKADISKEMRNAKGFFKETYASNIASSLKTLQRSDYLLGTTSGYSISKAKLEEAKAFLAS